MSVFKGNWKRRAGFYFILVLGSLFGLVVCLFGVFLCVFVFVFVWLKEKTVAEP